MHCMHLNMRCIHLNMRCIHFGTFTFAFHLLIKGEKEMKMCQLDRASAGAERGGIQLYFN